MKGAKRFRIWLAAAVAATGILALGPSAPAFAFHVTPIETIEMYASSATPVYAAPDVGTPVVVYLDRFTNVRVTGITDNGFFRVDLNGAFYIPGPYMLTRIEPEKTARQKALDDLDDLVDAYRMQLEFMESYSSRFALIDVTGDGIPEIFDEAGKEIYSYHDERPVMLYYSEYPLTFYYSKKDNKLMGRYTWNEKEMWEVYELDTSLLPWGQFRCVSTSASAYRGNASSISRDHKNDAKTRGELYEILKEELSLDD